MNMENEIELNTIYNEDCFETMKRMPDGLVNIVLTSPFYNTNKKQGKNRTLLNTDIKQGDCSYIRYDVHTDSMTNEEYNDFTVKLFENFDKVLAKNGVILYNLSYGNENSTGMIEAVNAVITRTNFTLADMIVWKKSCALPNNCSPNRLTRICEFVYVFCRKDETKTFIANKKVKGLRETGQKSYESISNFIEAKNNDGPCQYNKATYSSELCEKLLSMYIPNHDYDNHDYVIYDPFIGSGTTAVACEKNELNVDRQ